MRVRFFAVYGYVELQQHLFVLSQTALPMAILQTLVEKRPQRSCGGRWKILEQHGHGMPCPYSERDNVMFAVLFSLFCLQDAAMLYFLLVIAVYYPHFLRFVIRNCYICKKNEIYVYT